MTTTAARNRDILRVFSAILFCVFMILPAFHNTTGSGDAFTAYRGFEVALGGWVAFASDGWMLSLWACNPISVYIIIHPRSRISHFILSPVVPIVVIHAALYFRPAVIIQYWEVPALLTGYYVWITALLIAVLAAWLGPIDASEQTPGRLTAD